VTIDPEARIICATPDELGWSELTVTRETLAAEAAGELLARIVHVSDTHVCDAESPARLEYLDRLSDPDSIYRLRLGEVGTYRPQEILTVQVLTSLVEAINAHADEIDAVIVTGDLIDNAQANEQSWCAQVLDGGLIEPWSGDPQVSQWVGSREGHPWDERYWHPDGPTGAIEDVPTARFGYPRIPGLVEAARRPVVSPGVSVPWYAVPGNHDALLQGTVAPDPQLRDLAVGDRRIIGLPPGGTPLLTLEGVAPLGPARYVHTLDSPSVPIAADERRRLLDHEELNAPWVRDVGGVRFIAMDTVNPHGGWQGSIGSAHLAWLRDVLQQSADRYVVVTSHHPSWCLTNAYTLDEPRHLAAEVVHLLLDNPHVIAWFSGHVHAHASLWHERADGSGFWEITTASMIDWPQQARVIEIMRAGGGIAMRSTLLDHAAPARWSPDDLGDHRGLAAISRVLSANDYHDRDGVREMREGLPDARNTVWWQPDPLVRGPGLT
jgi:3',5'-cyclic AMP phosphodiesterase CpdA